MIILLLVSEVVLIWDIIMVSFLHKHRNSSSPSRWGEIGSCLILVLRDLQIYAVIEWRGMIFQVLHYYINIHFNVQKKKKLGFSNGIGRKWCSNIKNQEIVTSLKRLQAFIWNQIIMIVLEVHN